MDLRLAYVARPEDPNGRDTLRHLPGPHLFRSDANTRISRLVAIVSTRRSCPYDLELHA